MSALADLTPADLGILAEPRALSLYDQLAVAEFQARAAWDRMSAACCEISAAKLSGHGMPAALALYRSAQSSKAAAMERVSTLRSQIARAERAAGRLVPAVYLPRPAADELRKPELRP